MQRVFVFLVLVVAGALPFFARAEDMSSSNFIIRAPVLNSGGGFGTSASFRLFSAGEPIIGTSTSSSFVGRFGFLYFPFVTAASAVSASPGNAEVALSWTASGAGLGYNIGQYQIGQATISGGPYTFSNVGVVTASTRTGLANGTTYYFIVRTLDAFNNVIATSTQVSAAPAAPSSGGGGGGGGGGGAPVPSAGTATVVLMGRAYPDSTVTTLRDSVLVASQPVGETASFSVTIGNLAAGTYLFNLYATDKSGYRSASTPVPVTLAPGVSVTVTGIYLAPTIDVDKEQVRQGNPIRVFGHTSPTSTVSIMVNSENELFFEAVSDDDGVYAFSFVTSPLELGQHSTRSVTSKAGQVSKTSNSIAFKVGLLDVLKTKKTNACGTIRGDLNCDGKVNLIDFSIQAFWYKKQGFPVAYDLNNDKQITLTDFSIMASNWTG